MQIEIYDKKVEKVLNDSNIIKKVGQEMAQKIKLRCNQIRATDRNWQTTSFGRKFR